MKMWQSKVKTSWKVIIDLVSSNSKFVKTQEMQVIGNIYLFSNSTWEREAKADSGRLPGKTEGLATLIYTS